MRKEVDAVLALTKADQHVLDRAKFLARKFDSGIYPRGASQSRQFRKLVKNGFLKFDGWGRDIDGEVEADVPVYRLTALGRREGRE